MAEEWDSSAAQPSTGGFAGRGFGRGILGKTALPTDLTNGVGSTETKKFGSRGRGGLANKENVNGSDDVKPGFGNAPSFGGGFGSKRGGFGGGQSVPSNSSDSQPSRSGFGGGRGGFGGGRGGFGNSSVKNDWDNSENSDSKPGRGFGGARGGFGGGSSRYNDESSQSNQNRGFGTSRGGFGRGGARGFGFRNDSGDDAPRGGGFSQKYGRSRGCFKCGEDGHMSRDCPNGGGRGKCFKCGEDGHMARDCTSTDSSRSHGGGDGKCFKCNESGHMARACTNAESFSGGADRPVPYIPPAPTDDESEIFKSIEKGINFDKYDTISVEVSGRDPVNFISSFDEAGLYPSFLRNVKRAGYEKPTPVQKYAIPIIAAGRDLMACAQTGSGKTAAFLLPVLTAMMNQGLQTSQFSIVQYPQAVIVAPTRELACQIYMDARKFSHSTDVRPVVVYGGTSVGYQIREVEKGAHLVVGTPGRLLDMINKQKISLEKVSFLVLDEADRMLDMGFEPEIRKMVETMGMPHKTARQTLMFSATFPEEIQKLAADFLNDYLFVTVGRVGGANTDVEQNVFEVDRLRKRDKLCEILTETGSDKTLVFVEQKRNADFLASYLSQSGFPTTSIHGDRQQREREEALRDFKKGTAPILIATSVAARGLDIPNVKHVINYDLPSSIDEYVHRIGRTGRCGNLGKATSFYSNEQDSTIVKSLVRILTEANQIVPEWLETYALTSTASIDTSSSLFSGKYGGKDIRHGKFNSGGKGGNAWEDKWGGGDAAIDTGGDAEEWD